MGPITLETRLNYRKFTDYYTKYAFAGVAQEGEAGLAFDSRKYSFDSAPVPEIPIVTLAEDTKTIQLGEPNWGPVLDLKDRERWNDWGIGLLQQGDLRGAEYAFDRVMEIEPDYVDGWVNATRALINEGEVDKAKPLIDKALEIQPGLARALFFRAMIEKANGDYDAALESLGQVRQQYPRDRVALNQIGRILFLERRYQEAVDALRQVLDIDTEDVQAHYTLMLAYRGLGDMDQASREEELFRRFKADESSQELTAKPRQLSPEDNNERQPIHDHASTAGLSGGMRDSASDAGL